MTLPICTVPIFNLMPGVYRSPQYIPLSCATSGASINYSFGSIIPTSTVGGPCYLYDNPITLTRGITINAIAYREGYSPSAVVSASYVVYNMFFIKDILPSDLLPGSGLSVFNTKPSVGTQFIQRFRYRGLRETTKWNSFLYGQESDINNMQSFLSQLHDSYVAATLGYLMSTTYFATTLFAKLAVFNQTQSDLE